MRPGFYSKKLKTRRLREDIYRVEIDSHILYYRVDWSKYKLSVYCIVIDGNK